MRLLSTATTLAATAMFAFAPTSAMAWHVNQGADFTSTINNERGYRACDQEPNDGHSMWGKARDGQYREDREADGNDRWCDRRPNPDDIGSVWMLETCENVPYRPDYCSGWYKQPGN